MSHIPPELPPNMSTSQNPHHAVRNDISHIMINRCDVEGDVARYPNDEKGTLHDRVCHNDVLEPWIDNRLKGDGGMQAISQQTLEQVVASDMVLIQGDVMTRERVGGGPSDDDKHSGGNHFTNFPIVGLFHTQVVAYLIALPMAPIEEQAWIESASDKSVDSTYS
jgi:hypothetical protein